MIIGRVLQLRRNRRLLLRRHQLIRNDRAHRKPDRVDAQRFADFRLDIGEAPVLTWGQTRCAPALPLAMHQSPINSADPAIPTVAANRLPPSKLHRPGAAHPR